VQSINFWAGKLLKGRDTAAPEKSGIIEYTALNGLERVGYLVENGTRNAFTFQVCALISMGLRFSLYSVQSSDLRYVQCDFKLNPDAY